MNSESREFAERVSQLSIDHPKIKRIWDMFDSIRAHRKLGGNIYSPRHMFIIGDSGVGKSQMAKKYAALYPGYTRIDGDGTEYDIRPVVFMELPDPFTILEFYQSIVKALGAPELVGRPTIGEVKRQAFELIKSQEVEVLLLDEMDYILSSKYVKREQAMEAIKHVGNTANISLVCIGTPDAEPLQSLNFQYFRRFPITRLERFTECDDEFCSFLSSIEEYLKPPKPIGLGDKVTFLPQLLHESSKGLVGIITPTIQEAYRLLGVFEDDLFDYSKDVLTPPILIQAYKKIVGDQKVEDFERKLKK